MAILEICNLTKRFGDVIAIDSISFPVEEGKVTAILGPSGSGKTVLVKHIVGLMKPTSGKILFKGTEITNLSERDIHSIRKHFSMLLQDGALFDSMTVEENISFPLKMRGGYTKEEIKTKVLEILKSMRLSGFGKRMPSELSGGQKRRVALARALISEPDVLIFDEPTTGLDPITTETVEELLIETRKRRKDITYILITHDPYSAYKIADNIAVLYNGKLVTFGKRDEVFELSKEDKLLFGIFKRANIEFLKRAQ